MRPIFKTGMQGLLDEQATQAGAVDKQITFDALTAVQLHGLDEAVARPLVHLHDAPFGALRATRLGVAAQEAGIQASVEVKGVDDVAQR